MKNGQIGLKSQSAWQIFIQDKALQATFSTVSEFPIKRDEY